MTKYFLAVTEPYLVYVWIKVQIFLIQKPIVRICPLIIHPLLKIGTSHMQIVFMQSEI
jgi:hypothetical protein